MSGDEVSQKEKMGSSLRRSLMYASVKGFLVSITTLIFSASFYFTLPNPLLTKTEKFGTILNQDFVLSRCVSKSLRATR